jgi:hypothetical protein
MGFIIRNFKNILIPSLCLIFNNCSSNHGTFNMRNDGRSFKKEESNKDNYDYLNKSLENFKHLSTHERDSVIDSVKNLIDGKIFSFEPIVQNYKSKGKLDQVNFIMGITGAGKSTLFDYLMGIPLIVRQSKDQYGRQTVQGAVLEIDENYARKAQLQYSPIATGFNSETEANLWYDSRQHITHIDCAGVFDTRGLLQSIINSYLRLSLLRNSNRIKFSLVVDYNDLITNRAVVLGHLLQEVRNTVSDWEYFSKSNCICLIFTHVPPGKKSIVESIPSMLSEMVDTAKDLQDFRAVLKNIIAKQGGLIGVFPAPAMKIVGYGDDEEEIIPDGEVYKPNPNICSPEILSKIIGNSNFLHNNEKNVSLFCENVDNNCRDVVDRICEHLVKDCSKLVLDKFDALLGTLLSKSNDSSFQKKWLDSFCYFVLQNQQNANHVINKFLDSVSVGEVNYSIARIDYLTNLAMQKFLPDMYLQDAFKRIVLSAQTMLERIGKQIYEEEEHNRKDLAYKNEIKNQELLSNQQILLKKNEEIEQAKINSERINQLFDQIAKHEEKITKKYSKMLNSESESKKEDYRDDIFSEYSSLKKAVAELNELLATKKPPTPPVLESEKMASIVKQCKYEEGKREYNDDPDEVYDDFKKDIKNWKNGGGQLNALKEIFEKSFASYRFCLYKKEKKPKKYDQGDYICDLCRQDMQVIYRGASPHVWLAMHNQKKKANYLYLCMPCCKRLNIDPGEIPSSSDED